MVNPLLETKLYLPRPRRALVPRSRLRARLDRGAEATLTLVCAPAGFGKTTLLAEWLAAVPASSQPAAWLSLDQGDNQPATFWTYLVAALRTAVPGIGAGAFALLESPQPPPIEAVLAALLNDLGALPRDLVLVLDDYHAIDARDIHAGMAFLLDHIPETLHLVIASRADPPLPLARLRARGELVELRAADLRFTLGEAAAFLNEAMGLDLAAADVAALEVRTEGWVVGLQLAALSLQGRADVAEFVGAFAGDDRYVLDYLVEEVLQRQPAEVRRFLLHTAILDRLSGSLCDAVTGQDDGNGVLAALERGNLFIVPLDDKRHWYRYHHLFADVLHAHLLAEQPEQIATLHRRASAWHERQGVVAEAIRHALAAEDVGRAADLIESAVPAMRRSRQEATVLGWLRALPDALVRRRPVLSAAYAWALLTSGELAGVEARLQDAEHWLEATAATGERPETTVPDMVVVDEAEFRCLPGALAVYRAGQALALGDLIATVHHARRALVLITGDDHLWRGAAASLLGLASWAGGDLVAAHRAYAEGMASVRRAGNLADVLGCAIALADIQIAQGRLHEALRTYEQALPLVPGPGALVLRGTADLYVGLAELHRERDDLDAATRYLQRSKALGEHAGLPRHPYRWCVAMSRLREAQGDLDGALALLHEAERRYMSDFFPDVRPVAALRARVWVAQGRQAEALGWARAQGLSTEDDLSYLREFEHLTLARVLLARARHDRDEHAAHQANSLLVRLLAAAQAGERAGSAIEILLLQALVHQMRGDIPAALVPLHQALTLAEPERYVRLFVDEGQAMRDILRHAAAGGGARDYARRLLAAFDGPRQPTLAPPQAAAANLVEPLTAREVAVLRLVAAGLRNQEIAAQLYIGLATVKRHIANAYGKLGVSHRTEAVARANELHLL